MADENVWGTLAEMMIVSEYTGILLIVGVAVLATFIFWRRTFVMTRVLLGVGCLAAAGALYFGYAATLG
jgi:hypothetical protein